MRKVLRVAAIAAVGTGLLSCSPRPPAAAEPLPPPAAYAPSAPVVHAPLPPPAGYLPPPASYARPPRAYAPPVETSYGERAPVQYETRPQTDPAQLGWRASPRWASVKREASTRPVKKDPDAKFKAAQAKAEKLGVHTLTEQDIAGLTPEQITQIRGY